MRRYAPRAMTAVIYKRRIPPMNCFRGDGRCPEKTRKIPGKRKKNDMTNETTPTFWSCPDRGSQMIIRDSARTAAKNFSHYLLTGLTSEKRAILSRQNPQNISVLPSENERISDITPLKKRRSHPAA